MMKGINKKITIGVAIVAVVLILVIFYKEFTSNEGFEENELEIGARCVAGDWPYCGCTPPDVEVVKQRTIMQDAKMSPENRLFFVRFIIMIRTNQLDAVVEIIKIDIIPKIINCYITKSINKN